MPSRLDNDVSGQGDGPNEAAPPLPTCPRILGRPIHKRPTLEDLQKAGDIVASGVDIDIGKQTVTHRHQRLGPLEIPNIDKETGAMKSSLFPKSAVNASRLSKPARLTADDGIKDEGAATYDKRSSTDPRLDQSSRPDANKSREVTRAKIKEVFSLLEETPLHIVCPTQAIGPRPCTLVHSTKPNHTSAIDVPSDAEAIIVLLVLNDEALCKRLVTNLRSQGVDLPPIITVLLETDSHIDAMEIMEIQEAFQQLDVNELIVQRNNSVDLCVDIALAIRRAKYALTKMNEEIDRSITEHDHRKFWPCVHKIFEDFPPSQGQLVTSFKAGTMIGSTHKLIERVGKGAFSTVYKCVDMCQGVEHAMKVISKEQLRELSQVTSIWAEFTLLRKLEHPNVVELVSFMHSRDHILIAMEFAGRLNLYRFIKKLERKLSLPEVTELQRQIASALAYCHEQDVAHRDLKPENIAVQRDGGKYVVKILDFGCAVKGSKTCYEVAGTMPFMAPEILLMRPHSPKYSDVWSCGVILLETLCYIDKMANMLEWSGPLAPKEKYGKQLEEYFRKPMRMIESVRSDEGNENLCESVEEALIGILNPNPCQRWTMSQMKSCRWLAPAAEAHLPHV